MHRSLHELTPTTVSKLHLIADLVIVGWMTWTLGAAGLETLEFVVLATLLTLGWLTAAAALRAYQPAAHPRRSDQGAAWAAQALVASFSALFIHALTDGDLPESTVLFAVAAALGVNRAIMFRLGRFFGIAAEQVLIVGVGPLARVLGGRLEKAGIATVAGHIPLKGEVIPLSLKDKVLGQEGSLAKVLTEVSIDQVYVAGHTLKQADAMQSVVTVCEELGMPFALPAHALTLERAQAVNLDPRDLGFVHHISSDPRPMARGVKRLFDVLASAAALVALSPLLLSVAAIIKLTSKGPVLFHQRRVGLHGRVFNMLKFRSMVVGAEAKLKELAAQNEQTGPVFKMKNDPRVTRIGKFIRRYSIDELPQLINILRGDMSVVGPRPPVPHEVAQYEPWQRRRLSVRPGLTCHWQVSGRNNISFEQWMLLDMRYIDQWTFLTDLRLIARTVPAVFTGHGAS